MKEDPQIGDESGAGDGVGTQGWKENMRNNTLALGPLD